MILSTLTCLQKKLSSQNRTALSKAVSWRTIWLSERSTRACRCHRRWSRSEVSSIQHYWIWLSSPFQCSPNPISCLWSRPALCCLFNIAIKWWRGRNCFTKSVDCSAGCGALLEEGCFLTSVLDSGFINLRTKRLHQQNRGGRRDCVQRCIFVRFLLHTKPTVATPALGCEPLDLISFQIQPKILPLGWYIKDKAFNMSSLK